MNANIHSPLIEAWRQLDVQTPDVHILEADRQYLEGIGYFAKQPHLLEPLCFKKFLNSPRFGQDDGFHFSLLPIPYAGNLASADIFILMLNPGFHEGDYYAEYENQEFRSAALNSLRQDFSDSSYWFQCLNPAFCWHPGYGYWTKKLGSLISELAKHHWEGNSQSALLEVSRRIAVVESVPYHSRSFKDGALLNELPSALLVKSWVHEVLLPKALRGEAVVVVTRQSKNWGLKEIPGSVVCYEKSEARGAHLSVNSRGGALILKKLLSQRGNRFVMN